MLLEICTPTLESVEAAVTGGADRIELCENLEVGGTTPSQELIRQVREQFDIDIQVLVRPRGGDFVYTADEIRQTVDEIQMAKSLGVEGVVVGALKPNTSLDLDALTQFKEAASGIQITFHKAMDEVKEPIIAIESLIALAYNRILTSGGKPTAVEGLADIRLWQKQFGNQIGFMPGGSIRPENANLFKGYGFPAIHSAAIRKGQIHSDQATVARLAEIIRA